MPTLTRAEAIDREIRLLVDELLLASGHYRNAKTRYRAREEYFDAEYGDSVRAEFGLRDDWHATRFGRHCAWYGNDVTRLGTALSALIAAERRGGDEHDWHPTARPADEGYAVGRPR